MHLGSHDRDKSTPASDSAPPRTRPALVGVRPGGLAAPALALLLFAGGPSRAATIHVPADVPSISGALGMAVAGDTVQVAPGVYSSTVSSETFPLVLTADVSLIGAGFAQCAIDAEGQAGVIEISAAAGGRVSGFTLTGGETLRGGGIRINGGSPEIDANLIVANAALNAGSGLFIVEQASPWVHHNVIWQNHDLDLNDPGDPHGVQLIDADGTIEHNLIGRTDSNGLLTAGDSNPSIRNNIFFENGIEGVRGRGICHFGGDEAVIAHNLFHGNVIAAILIAGHGDLSAAKANAIAPNDPIYGNLDGDPEFVDPDQQMWNLQPTSPAIDAGDPASPPDPDGTVADIGPFYFDQSGTGVPDGMPQPPRLLLAVAPNPFQAETVFRYLLASPAAVQLTVHDVNGRLVTTLVDRIENEGEHRTVWEGRDRFGRPLANGVYFARLAVGGAARVQKLLLAR